ncbi:Arabinose 5-phosphate isomerase KpsF [Pirellulimonas nuda]|uniref:Arabinose 5-phosphate isomerase KpsF n=1 Tax=Pirellulimonas nuda TaxID=2528009 RepID=A0A518DJ93_9BACT|nr:KpsF/GutQ family sugar-phosphate isomerase [Pirellulimonas nuda]QDU91551.1 Arabinose 5-phosphate isomerase KpsF [Pirellulimonas nuda]
MSRTTETQREPQSLTPLEQLQAAREVIRVEAAALWAVSNRIGPSVGCAIELLLGAAGSVIVTGMGKAGLVGQKIAATLASTGARAHFVHPAEAFHGDLGRIHADDVVLILSQSGETEEVTRLLPSLAEIGAPTIALTASRASTLGRSATHVIELGKLDEACSLGLAPSTSTTAMLAVGDALALVLSKMRGFGAEDFARFHPGGSLGRKLSRVDDWMRPLDECRVAPESQTVRQVIVACRRPGRRTGAVMLVNAAGKLTGLFTDSDLARMFERRDESALDSPVSSVMAAAPTTVQQGARLGQAMSLLSTRKFSELPVVDAAGKPVGLLDVTDVLGVTGDEADVGAKNKAPSVRIFPSEDLFAAG